MSENRTLRWGSTETITLNPAESIAVRTVPRQMLQLAWDVPLSWVVFMAMNPQFDASEAHTFTVQWVFTIGVGQATQDTSFLFTFAPSGGVYTPQNLQTFLPGENIQAKVSLLGTIGATKPETFQFAVWGAPNNADVLGELRRHEAMHGGNGGMRDMPMGYGPENEAPLVYGIR